jgi:hypothetical protein
LQPPYLSYEPKARVVTKTIKSTREQYNTMYAVVFQERKSNNMLKKSMEEMKEMVINLRKNLHNLFAMNGFVMTMAFDVTSVLTMNYFIKHRCLMTLEFPRLYLKRFGSCSILFCFLSSKVYM